MRLHRILIILFLTHCVSASEVRLNVVDENGGPLEGATVVVGIASYMNLKSKELTGLTNETGYFSARGNSNHSIYYRVWKSGFYAAEEKRLAADKDHDLAIVLPEIRNPRPPHYYRGQSEGVMSSHCGHVSLTTPSASLRLPSNSDSCKLFRTQRSDSRTNSNMSIM